MRPLRALGLLAAAIAMSQCGLPSSFYLNPPGQGTQALPGTPFFYVVSTTLNSEAEFKGFDIYYKFYPSLGNVPPTTDNLAGSTHTYEDLVSAGYTSVCASTDSSASSRVLPLITVPTSPTNYRGTSFSIEFTIDVDGTFSYVTANPTVYGAPSSMSRGIANNTNTSIYATSFKINMSAPYNYTTADADFGNGDPALFNALYATSVYLAMYAVSVGYDSTEGYIRSYPIFLGYVRMNANG
jgi:hypothetical protein